MNHTERLEHYRELCRESPDIPLFSKDWWLDAVCGKDNWDVALVFQNDRLVGALPYYVIQRYGFRFIKKPLLTPHLFPYIRMDKQKNCIRQIKFQQKIFKQLIKNIPHFHYFDLHLHYDIKNWLPFYWAGFDQTTKYSFLIEDLSDINKIWESMDKSARKNIRSAKKRLNVIEKYDMDLFFEINKQTYQKQGINPPYSKELLDRIVKFGLYHNAIKVLFAFDSDNRIHSVMMGGYDQHSLYMLAGSSDIQLRSSGAEYLLYWEMIRFASSMNLRFDFEGSMMENIEIRNRSFGAKQTQFFQIKKVNSRLLRFYHFLLNEIH